MFASYCETEVHFLIQVSNGFAHLAQFLSTQLKSKSLFQKTSKVFNLRKKICGLFHVSAQFLLTRSKKELEYYPQKVNIRVA